MDYLCGTWTLIKIKDQSKVTIIAIVVVSNLVKLLYPPVRLVFDNLESAENNCFLNIIFCIRSTKSNDFIIDSRL
jgi:hypothetical protein